MQATYRLGEEIEWAASRFPCVRTDNRDALIALGFQPLYPNAESDYERRIWVRAVDHAVDPASTYGLRRRIMQRAFLHDAYPQ